MDKLLAENYPDLSEFMGICFHEDFLDDYGSDRESFDDNIQHVELSQICAVSGQLDALVDARLNDKILAQLIYSGFGACYNYAIEDLTSTEWLERLSKWIKQVIEMRSQSG